MFFIAFACAGGMIATSVWAQGAHPFGVPEAPSVAGVPEFLRDFVGYVSYWQSHFYRQLTGAVRSWQDQGGFGGLLIGLSFAYGVFHALGPGHGKAVIASYVLANQETALNGARLALAASLVQAMVAIALVSLLAVVFNVTSSVMNEATRLLETAAYAMVVVLGLMLVWRKMLRPLVRQWQDHRATAAHHHSGLDAHGLHDAAAPFGRERLQHAGGAHTGEAPASAHAHTARGVHEHRAAQHVLHDDCCGHAHVPAPETVSGPLDLRRAWIAILGVGLRPCSGALIVLVFALAQDFYLAGIAAALAMGVGTGLTVAALAVLSAWSRHVSVRIGGLLSSRAAAWTRYVIESLAAVLVLTIGLLLFCATLLGNHPPG